MFFRFLAFFCLSLSLLPTFAAKRVFLHGKASEEVLQQFTWHRNSNSLKSAPVFETNALKERVLINYKDRQIVRYRQYFKNIPLSSSEIIVVKNKKTGAETVNGAVTTDMNDIDVTPQITGEEALSVAKNAWSSNVANAPFYDEKTELQLRNIPSSGLKLVYLVSFRSVKQEENPAWLFYVVDAKEGKVLNSWNNINNYQETGPGGNEKTKEYWYGKASLPFLDVKQNGNNCVMEDERVKVIHLNSQMDWYYQITTPYEYPCGSNFGDEKNGGFSPANDAWFFGHILLNFFNDWYSVSPIKEGPLVMRVHFGKSYANAFWDGKTLTFGDGDGSSFHPLISITIATHEAAHGLTSQYSALEYHDESGALNEAFSDMAGITAKAYFLEKEPQLYEAIYHKNALSWFIGESILRENNEGIEFLRNVEEPNQDGVSADCYSREISEKNGGSCSLSYSELEQNLKRAISNAENRQSFLVHYGSGVFNRAFFLLSEEVGVQSAFRVMLTANMNYWTPETNFREAACGVLNAGSDVDVSRETIRKVFLKVGIDTDTCE